MRVTVSALALGCALLLPAGNVLQAQPGPLAVHVATVPVDAGAEAFYAADQGFFKSAAIDPAVEVITSGAAIAAAVASDAVDVGYSNVFSLVQAVARGAPITLIAAGGLASADAPTAQMIVAKSSPYRSAKDLDGKVFATDALRTLSEFGARAWMDRNGGDSTTIKFVEIPFPEIEGALTAHRADAALLPEPFLTRAKPNVTLVGDPYPSIARQFIIGAYFTSTAWARAHPDAVKRFQEAIQRSAVWANKNRTASAAILAKYTKIDPNVLIAMARVRYAETLTPALLQPTIDIAAKYHAIDRTFPASAMIFH